MSQPTSPNRKRKTASSWKPWLAFWGPSFVLMIAGFVVAWMFVQPAPPDRVIIATGREDGAYYAFGRQYAKLFGQNGIELIVKPTAGSVENLGLLEKLDSRVDLAIVQGGTLPPKDQLRQPLEAIAAMYLEPMWVFHRIYPEPRRLSDLAGRRLAIGAEGSGSRLLAEKLFTAAGLGTADDPAHTQLLPLAGAAAADALRNGQIDAAIFVLSPSSSLVRDLLLTEGIGLMSFAAAEGLARNFQYLSVVTLYSGSVDLRRNLPAEDVTLVAPAAMLVARADTHDAITLLAAQAVSEVHSGGTLLNSPGAFPTIAGVELPVSKEAEHFFKRGPSALHRNLPFWAASFIDRMLIMLLPVLTLLIPLIRFAPPIYRWRVRARIYRWYTQVQQIDAILAHSDSREELSHELQRMNTLENEVRKVAVPLSYMEEFYHLRLHLNFVAQKLEARLAQL